MSKKTKKSKKRDAKGYDSTVARMAGNIAAGIVSRKHQDFKYDVNHEEIAYAALGIAERIIEMLTILDEPSAL